MPEPQTVSAIYGEDLIRIAKETDNPQLAEILDPSGWSIVDFMFPHNDGPDFRLVCLFKIANSREPFEGTITIPGHRMNIVRMLRIDDKEKH